MPALPFLTFIDIFNTNTYGRFAISIAGGGPALTLIIQVATQNVGFDFSNAVQIALGS